MLNCNGAAAYKVGRDLAAKTSYASYYAGFEASFSMKLDAGYDAVLRRQRLRVMLPKKAIRDKTHKLQLIFFAGLEGSGHHLWEKSPRPLPSGKELRHQHQTESGALPSGQGWSICSREAICREHQYHRRLQQASSVADPD
jgi:hypothetical protein